MTPGIDRENSDHSFRPEMIASGGSAGVSERHGARHSGASHASVT
jgi:hypothetical protein